MSWRYRGHQRVVEFGPHSEHSCMAPCSSVLSCRSALATSNFGRIPVVGCFKGKLTAEVARGSLQTAKAYFGALLKTLTVLYEHKNRDEKLSITKMKRTMCESVISAPRMPTCHMLVTIILIDCHIPHMFLACPIHNHCDIWFGAFPGNWQRHFHWPTLHPDSWDDTLVGCL